MDIKTRETYSEVYSILNMLGETYIIKIPSKLYQMIKEEKLNEYNPKYDSTLALEQPNIKNETLSMIALFHLNYWCDSQEEKQELKDLFNENEIKYQEELKEKYKEEVAKDMQTTTNEVAIVEYKENVFKKIINKILNLFKLR